MPFLPMAELLRSAMREGYAVPAFCAWNADIMETVLAVAGRKRAPVVLMQGPLKFDLLSPASAAAVARALASHHDLLLALHLDHGDSLALVEACLAAGYTSVMLDYSARPYQENASALRRVVELAHPLGVTVEGEIGHVGRVSDASQEGVLFPT